MNRISASLVALFALLLFCRASAANGHFTPYVLMENDGSREPADADRLIAVNGTLFFRAFSGSFSEALWKSDGTRDGTVRVHSVSPPAGAEVFQIQAAVGDTLFYAANILQGGELWKSDGTEVGTVRVKDIRPGPDRSSPGLLSNVDGTLFFMANGGIGASGLWKSDGTELGTNFLQAANTGGIAGGESASDIVAASGGNFYFRNLHAETGFELWKSDGTSAGTHIVEDIRVGNFGSFPRSLTDVDGTLFFTAQDDTIRRKLWKTDGTESGTMVVKDIPHLTPENQWAPRQLVEADGTLFFTAVDHASGIELWKSDGTEAGTVLVKDINPGTMPGGPHRPIGNSSFPTRLTNVNGTLYFSANDGTHGHELWKSDGTPEGTQMVADISPGSDSSLYYYGTTGQYSEYVAVDDLLFFTAAVSNAAGIGWDHSLYVTDGTAEGTSALLTFEGIGTGTPPIRELTFTGTHLFFRGATQLGGTGVPTSYGLFAIAIVPEPGTMLLVGLACSGLIGINCRRRR